MVIDSVDLLSRCLMDSISPETNEFQWERFFRLWFRENGSSLFFLFKKNLGVTNVQFAELFSLIREYCVSEDTDDHHREFLFYSTDEMKDFVVETLNTLLDVSIKETAENEKRIRSFAEQYQYVFDSSIIVDTFYCSCAVFLPAKLQVDIAHVCSNSGYIHSAGNSVFIRNIKKAKIYDFEDSLKQHLASKVTEFPVPFVVYAHEDFSEWDKHSKDEITRGIDDVKMHLEKMSMSRYRLPLILNNLRKQYQGQLLVPEAGSYEEKQNFGSKRCLFLIADRSVNFSSPERPGSQRYYICYEQLIKNENPFYFFDENKPAWKSHTTMPHSLTSALLNMVRPIREGSTIVDPFGGTGTTWFEVKRLGFKVNVQCSDISAISNVLVRDNLDFFLMDSEKLKTLISELDEISKLVRQDQARLQVNIAQASLFQEKEIATPYLLAIRLLNELQTQQPDQNQEYDFDGHILTEFLSLTKSARLMFYIALRAKLRFPGAHARKSRTFSNLFLISLDELKSQIVHLQKVRALMESGLSSSTDDFVVFRENYSDAVFPAFLCTSLDDAAASIESEVLVRDARHLEPNSVDVVICDPPYGFNTTEGQLELGQLYAEFIFSAVRAVRNRGHLIICLPAESYTGQDLPYCTRSGLVTGQVLSAARVLNKHIFRSARLVPNSLFSPPYYWESEKALRRIILHFRVGFAHSKDHIEGKN